MKKITFILCLLFSTINTFSQKNSYGLLLGANAYDVQISNVGNSGSYSKYNIGGFFEHQMSNHFGAKSYLLYTNTDNGDYTFYSNPDFNFKNTESKTLQIHLLLKYDISKEYNKGFYTLGGLRVTNLLDVQSDQYSNLDDEFFKKTNYGILLGVGVNFAKHYSLELVGDRSISNPNRSDQYKAKTLGAYFNFLINIESFLQK